MTLLVVNNFKKTALIQNKQTTPFYFEGPFAFMDRNVMSNRQRPTRRRPMTSSNTNNNNHHRSEEANEVEPQVPRPRLQAVRRQPVTNNNRNDQSQSSTRQSRTHQRHPFPLSPAHVGHRTNDNDQVIDLITPPTNRLAVDRNIILPEDYLEDDEEHLRRELFVDLDDDSDDEDSLDEPQFLRASDMNRFINDDNDDSDDPQEDINSLLDTLQQEERESEQERADRELARRLQLQEDFLSIGSRHFVPPHHHHHHVSQQAPQVATSHHFGEIRDDEFARRIQHSEIQEQTAARRRSLLEQLLARYGMHERPRLFFGGSVAQPNTARSLMALHFVDRDFDERDYEMLLQLDEQLPNRKMADTKLVEKVPTKIVKAGETFDRCSVCLCDTEEGEVRRELPCGHGFHQDCIDKWLKEYNETCPICKQSLTEMESKLVDHSKKDKKRKMGSKSARRSNKRRKVSKEHNE